jgi:hypothetical protein
VNARRRTWFDRTVAASSNLITDRSESLAAARYDLHPGEVDRLLGPLLRRHDRSTGRFVVFVVSAHDPLADVTRTIERTIFEESFGNDAAQMATEYRPYEKDSRFLLVADRRRGGPAGSARIIEGTGPGTKTLDDAPALIGRTPAQIAAAHGLNGEKLWDYATVAVLKDYRGRRSALAVSSLLYRAVLLQGQREGVRHLTAMLDRGIYRNMKLIGTPFVNLAGSGPFAYLGSAENRAVYADFPAIAPAISAQADRLRRLARPGLSDILRADPQADPVPDRRGHLPPDRHRPGPGPAHRQHRLTTIRAWHWSTGRNCSRPNSNS